MDPAGPATPCGLVAKSLFNDKFSNFKDAKGTEIKIHTDNIAWKTDRDYKFKNVENVPDDIGTTPKTNTVKGEEWKNVQWIDMTNGKLLMYIKSYLFLTYRTFHCLDEICRTSYLQKIVG